MLAWVYQDSTHVLVGVSALLALGLVVAGLVFSFKSADPSGPPAPSLFSKVLGALERLPVGIANALAFVVTRGWFYGAIADLCAMIASVAPVVLFVSKAMAGLVAQEKGGAAAAKAWQDEQIPALTVGQTVYIVAFCALALVFFRGVAAALEARQRSR